MMIITVFFPIIGAYTMLYPVISVVIPSVFPFFLITFPSFFVISHYVPFVFSEAPIKIIVKPC